MNSILLSKYHVFLFFIILIGVFAYFDFFDILFLRPQSVHQWRQTDCLSIALNYFNENLPLLEPKMHHLIGNNGKTVGEFPVLYYITAQLYNLFGENEFILRLINLSIFTIGLIYLYKSIFLLTRDYVFSNLLSLFILSSTIIIYYANNFLPDTPSLGFTFISWYYYLLYYRSKKWNQLISATILITIAGLIKTTALITSATICIFFFYTFLKLRELNWKELLLVVVPFFICGIWILYARHYKEANENFYLLMDVKPIWNESIDGIKSVWNRLTTNQNWGWKKYIYPPLQIWLVTISIPILLF